MAVNRQVFARLKKLLFNRDPELIVQGVELVVSLGDPEIWDALLDGVSWSMGDGTAVYDPFWDGTGSTRTPGAFVPNKLFDSRWSLKAHRQLALTLLAAHSEGPLRERVRSLGISSPLPPLDALASFPRLTRLVVHSDGELDLAPIGDWPALEELVIPRAGGLSLAGLGRCRTLRYLELSCPYVESTAGLEGAALDELWIRSESLRDLRGLDQTPVRTVTVHSGRDLDVRALARAPRLESAHLYAPRLALDGLAGANLAVLSVEADEPVELPRLPSLRSLSASRIAGCAPQPAVTELTLQGRSLYRWYAEPPPPLQIPPLASTFPALRSLTVYRAELRDLSFLRGSDLQRLSLRGCRIDDASALGSLAGLGELDLDAVDVERLDDLPPARCPMGRLDLASTRIRSIRGLGRLEGLEVLVLRDCAALERLDGLEGSSIRILDLDGCTGLSDLSPLARMPRLEVVRLSRTGLGPDAVPPPAADLATFDPAVDLETAAEVERIRRAPRERREALLEEFVLRAMRRGTRVRPDPAVGFEEQGVEVYRLVSRIAGGFGTWLPDELLGRYRDARSLARYLAARLDRR